ncbi:MAG: hypothetical protein LBJ20_04190 [Candidatus Methanoplasma sp.]|jgi:hypothetical protein|nr:hypothetical protein [Candidatus Methanoplasma sp.]
MLARKNLYIIAFAIASVGLMTAFSFADGSADGESTVPLADSGGFDLAAALDGAVSGDTVTLREDSVLSRDAAVKSGVILNDSGFALRITAYSTLCVEGEFVSSGDLMIDFRSSVTVASGGVMSVDNGDRTATVAGSLEVYGDGIIRMGMNTSSSAEFLANGELIVEGTMALGQGTLNSSVEVRMATVTGTLRISDGSSFRVANVLTVGSAPALTTDMKNTASVNGKIVLADSAYVLAYGDSSFSTGSIRYPAVSTQFIIQGKVYATEYKDNTGKRAIVLPLTSGLRDFVLSNWKDSNDNLILSDTSAQIGSIRTAEGEVAKREYKIVLAEDPNIKWVVNGIDKGSSGEEVGVYGASMTINIRLAQGNTELPTVKMDGMPYKAGTSFTVTGDTIFTTSNNYPVQEGDITPILLIILAVLAAVLVIFLVALRTRNSKKK